MLCAVSLLFLAGLPASFYMTCTYVNAGYVVYDDDLVLGIVISGVSAFRLNREGHTCLSFLAPTYLMLGQQLCGSSV